MSLKFYLDTHISKQVAVQLRNKGVDVIHCHEVGMAEASDEEHLEYATEQGRAMVSIDKDFYRLNNQWLQEGKQHAGIFALAELLQGPGAIGKIVTTLLEYHELIEGGAATIEDDIVGKFFPIR